MSKNRKAKQEEFIQLLDKHAHTMVSEQLEKLKKLSVSGSRAKRLLNSLREQERLSK